MEPINEKIKSMMSGMGCGYNSDTKPETKEERYERLKRREEMDRRFFNDSIGDLNQKDGYNCEICRNKGGIMQSVEGNPLSSQYVVCRCMKMRKMIRNLKKSGLDKSIKEYSFEKYLIEQEWQRQVKEIAIKFTTDNEHTWFYIGGQSGSGKTHLCTAITAHYLRQNKTAKYMLWRDEITKLKANINNNEEYNAAITELKNVEVLYIDDLFKMGKDQNGNVQRPTVSDINIAFEILNFRYNNKDLITIISSERGIDEVMEIDEAIGGRIYELCSKAGYLINLKKDESKNYRKKGVLEL